VSRFFGGLGDFFLFFVRKVLIILEIFSFFNEVLSLFVIEFSIFLSIKIS
jgi:hypothetical protein